MMTVYRKLGNFDSQHLILEYVFEKYAQIKKSRIDFFSKNTVFIIGTFHISQVLKDYLSKMGPDLKLHNRYCHTVDKSQFSQDRNRKAPNIMQPSKTQILTTIGIGIVLVGIKTSSPIYTMGSKSLQSRTYISIYRISANSFRP